MDVFAPEITARLPRTGVKGEIVIESRLTPNIEAISF